MHASGVSFCHMKKSGGCVGCIADNYLISRRSQRLFI
jgi:hypothetical protein